MPSLQGGTRSIISPTFGRGNSAFGPAFRVGGSVPDPTAGLYAALGSILNATRPAATFAAIPSSAVNKQRVETLTKAAALVRGGDPAGGRKLAESLLAKNAADVSAIHIVALSHLAEQDYKRAERSFLKASALRPGDARLRSGVADARALQKPDDEVLAEARRRIQSPIHLAEGLGLLFRFVERNPTSADAFLLMSDGFADLRKPVQALDALDVALENIGDHRIDEIVGRARNFVSDYGGAGFPHDLLGRALVRAGRFREGLRELKIAVDIVPENLAYRTNQAGGLVARATARLLAGNLVGARADAHAAQAIDPGNTALRELDARVAAAVAARDINSGRFNKSLGELSIAAAKAPDDVAFKRTVAALYARVGAHFRNQGDDNQALSSYGKAFGLDPDSASVRRIVGELGHQVGLEDLANGRFDDAIKNLQLAFDANRGKTAYRQSLASAFDARGLDRVSKSLFKDAIADLRRAVELEPSNYTYLTHLSNAIVQNGG